MHVPVSVHVCAWCSVTLPTAPPSSCAPTQDARVWHGNGWGTLEWGSGQTLQQHTKSSLPTTAGTHHPRGSQGRLTLPPHGPTLSRLGFGFASVLFSSGLRKVSGELGWLRGVGSKIHVGCVEAGEGGESLTPSSHSGCQEH